MPILGSLLKNKRAGETNLAWNFPELSGPETLTLSSPDFENGAGIPAVHAGKHAGGQNRSPELTWTGVPEGTAQLLLVIQDVDSPTASPFVHGVALLDPGLEGLPAGGLNASSPAEGVRLLRSGMGRGYVGPAPIKGHGPHRYVFQLFACATEVTATEGGEEVEKAKPADVFYAVHGPILARGRLDGMYTR